MHADNALAVSGLWKDLIASQSIGAGVSRKQHGKQRGRSRGQTTEAARLNIDISDDDADDDASDSADKRDAADHATRTATMTEDDDFPVDMLLATPSGLAMSAIGGVAGASLVSKQTATYRWDVEAITPLKVTAGQLELTDSTLEFRQAVDDDTVVVNSATGEPMSPSQGRGSADDQARREYMANLLKPFKSRTMAFSEIAAIEMRRYQLQHIAVEVFSKDGRHYFFNLKRTVAREQFFSALKKFKQRLGHVQIISKVCGIEVGATT